MGKFFILKKQIIMTIDGEDFFDILEIVLRFPNLSYEKIQNEFVDDENKIHKINFVSKYFLRKKKKIKPIIYA